MLILLIQSEGEAVLFVVGHILFGHEGFVHGIFRQSVLPQTWFMGGAGHPSGSSGATKPPRSFIPPKADRRPERITCTGDGSLCFTGNTENRPLCLQY